MVICQIQLTKVSQFVAHNSKWILNLINNSWISLKILQENNTTFSSPTLKTFLRIYLSNGSFPAHCPLEQITIFNQECSYNLLLCFLGLTSDLLVINHTVANYAKAIVHISQLVMTGIPSLPLLTRYGQKCIFYMASYAPPSKVP